MPPEPLDLLHLGRERVIGVYLLETAQGRALFDCGPATCVPVLKQRLRERGVELQVHVSPVGAPHLIDPGRLEQSARRLYGDEFDTLWGELAPVPQENVRETGDRMLGLECFPSPGHASHHVCYLDRDGTLYAGDAAGVRIQPSRFVLPPTPPPEFDLAAWESTLDELERRAPERLALIHFGVAEDPSEHLAELRERLRAWTSLVGDGASEDEFETAGTAELGEDEPPYQQAMPLWQSYAGLRRYWDKRREAA